MKILVVHNRYLFAGGEDRVVELETDLLKSKGDEVVEYFRSNAEAYLISRKKQLQAAFEGMTRSRRTYRELLDLIKKHQPDVAHFHNPFFMMTPSAYDVCYDNNIPIIQSLHNYRFLCANGVFFRDGKVCERCLEVGGRFGVLAKCIHGSFLKSFVSTGILRSYRQRKVLQKRVSAFIAPSQFCKEMYCRYANLAPEKVIVKPHFLEDPGNVQEKGEYALYAGAIRDYKGISTLLESWKSISDFPLKLIGSIPPAGLHLQEFMKQKNIEFLGEKPFQEALLYIKKAAFIIVPSVCYETFSRVIIEAYAFGKPVIASDIGAIRERIIDGETGFLFKPGDERDLAVKVRRFIEDPQMVERMGKSARQVYENRYDPDKNYEQLISIYRNSLKKETH